MSFISIITECDLGMVDKPNKVIYENNWCYRNVNHHVENKCEHIEKRPVTHNIPST